MKSLHYLTSDMKNVAAGSHHSNKKKLTFYALREKRSFDLSSTFLPLTECYVDVCKFFFTSTFSMP